MRGFKAISVLILLLVYLIYLYFVNVGFRHVLPGSMLRWAGEKWTEGQYSESVRWFTSANVSALNAGMRWTIAGFYIKGMNNLTEEGNLEEALKKCSQAITVLDGYDDEGAVSYNCIVIEEKINRDK